MPTLRWLTRDEDVCAAEKVPYKLLEEEPELVHGDREARNMLIEGDNGQLVCGGSKLDYAQWRS